MGAPQVSEGPPPDLQVVGDRIQTLLDASSSGGVVARERAEELVRLVADLYGSGLERLLDIMYDFGRLDDGVLAALADDELVSSLLLVHGLHPYDVRARVELALESVRPYLGTHGGNVELIDVSDDGVVRLRLLGSCDGCPSSSATLSLAVEGAVEAAAPEVTAIEVESPEDKPAAPLISLNSLRVRLNEPEPVHGAAWSTVPELAALAAGSVLTCSAGDTPIVACRIGTELFAFRDACPTCHSSLAGAGLGRVLGGAAGDPVLGCPGCHGHFDVRRAGRSLEDDALHLDPLPLLNNGGTVSVAVPVPAPA
ncbi:MAG: NifU family protein [Jatrophihabitans sp.]|uniref:NifU family protein n=1 Tax=Jatrophihabitans sp. TaxID=1932789 RepID=UPI003914F3F3